MKKSAYIRFVLSFLLIFSMLSPIAVLAKDGKKYFKEGMKAEVAEDWDKAAEQFALAIAENPRNPEYRLHYVRALFNASQLYVRKGNALANEKDYKGAYEAFRRAYAYDPTNELAKAEMERMARLYKETIDGKNPDPNTPRESVRLTPTSFSRQNLPAGIVIPQKYDDLERYGPYPGGVDLQTLIRDLARELDLNVIFDAETFRTPRKINIELVGVTTAKALDYIFLQENLFFQRVGPRTIMVANNNARQKFQQLVLRTFYLQNANPKDVIDLIGRIIPAQPGRTPTIAIKDDATNSITIRDTAENIALMEQLIRSLDKDRAEVVMDVAIYEVSKSDLMQFGNQIGTDAQLTNLGGTTRGAVGLGGNDLFRTVLGGSLPGAFSAAIAIPSATLQAFQNKQNTRLLASTQIHAFNNEDSSARIGQRVPVRTATISNGFNNGNTPGQNNGFLSDVINYEQVGLTLKFKPLVFPNQDVQVAMEIESKDVVACAGQGGNPCFSERTIKGTARVQNNKTLMLASVAQDTQTDGRKGLPLLGLIPFIGRLFTAPEKNNRQVDIIIAVTPRVIRAPSILPEDTVERPTGSLAQPTNGSLDAMVLQEVIDEQLAQIRRIPTNTAVQLPDQKVEDQPVYVRTNPTETSSNTQTTPQTATPTVAASTDGTQTANIRPIDSTDVRTVLPTPTSDTSNTNLTNESSTTNSTETILPKPVPLPLQQTSLKPEPTLETNANSPTAQVRLLPGLGDMKAGEKTKIAVMIDSSAPFRSVVLGLKFDDKKLAVRGVSYGEFFGGDLSGKAASPWLNQNGKMYVTLAAPKNASENGSGVLAYIDVEALADGKHDLRFDTDSMSFDGKTFAVKF